MREVAYIVKNGLKEVMFYNVFKSGLCKYGELVEENKPGTGLVLILDAF